MITTKTVKQEKESAYMYRRMHSTIIQILKSKKISRRHKMQKE